MFNLFAVILSGKCFVANRADTDVKYNAFHVEHMKTRKFYFPFKNPFLLSPMDILYYNVFKNIFFCCLNFMILVYHVVPNKYTNSKCLNLHFTVCPNSP